MGLTGATVRRQLAVVLGLLALAQEAGAAQVVLHLSGQEYKGGPSFEVFLGGLSIGEGSVEPVPAAGEYRIFEYRVADELLAAGEPLRIRLTNDIFDGPGKDRNLFIERVIVGETQIAAEGITIQRANAEVGRVIKDGHRDIWSSQEVAVVAAPAGGWKLPETAVLQPASCSGKAAIVAVDYKSGTLNQHQKAVLGPLLPALRQAECVAVITGYASQGGSSDANLRASEARARLAAAYLETLGIPVERLMVVAGGSTASFGQDDASNQRVVVEIHSP